jgi:2-polyprenyl-3-methyl-5-hydroxy-6-metoxy-1,4-benzoquinol methylase
MNQEKIEILSVELLNQHRPVVEQLKMLAKSLGVELGWHYLLDLSWIVTQLGEAENKQILDAGAGIGLLQWYLAGHGATVFSADRLDRSDMSLRNRARYDVRGLRSQDLLSPLATVRQEVKKSKTAAGKLKLLMQDIFWILGMPFHGKHTGKVIVYNQDLEFLDDISDNSLDAIVSVSALEHNTPEALKRVVDAMMCKLKPGGVLLATLGAAREKDWFHEASKGWCYSDVSLRHIFDLPRETPSNYADYDNLFVSLKNCTELKDNLARFYFLSGDNGMPWGKWEPQYQTVGVCKVKR